MFGSTPHRKVFRKGKQEQKEIFDMCGQPLPPGSRLRPVGPDRKVYHSVPKSRSASVPLSSPQPLPQKKSVKLKPLGPNLTVFQRSQQLLREQAYSTVPNVSTNATVAASPSRSEHWENVPLGYNYPSPSVHQSPPLRKAGVLRNTIFGMVEEDPKELERRERIRQENIMSTRRYRAGIPEPVSGVEEAKQRVMRAESENILRQASRMQQNSDAVHGTLIPTSVVGGTISVDKSYPYQRQLQGRRMRDALVMEQEIEKAMAKMDAGSLKKVVPEYRTKVHAVSPFQSLY